MKKHFKEHWKYYAIGAGSAIVTGTIVFLVMRNGGLNRVIQTVGDGSIFMNNVAYTTIERQGPPSWVVRCLETGEVFTSQQAASKAMNLSAAHISSHLNGARAHVNGYHFDRLCMAIA